MEVEKDDRKGGLVMNKWLRVSFIELTPGLVHCRLSFTERNARQSNRLQRPASCFAALWKNVLLLPAADLPDQPV